MTIQDGGRAAARIRPPVAGVVSGPRLGVEHDGALELDGFWITDRSCTGCGPVLQSKFRGYRLSSYP